MPRFRSSLCRHGRLALRFSLAFALVALCGFLARLALASAGHIRSPWLFPTGWRAFLKHAISVMSFPGAFLATSTYMETRNPPIITMARTDSSPPLGRLPKNHALEKAYTKALKQLDDVVQRIIENDPIVSSPEFRNRTAGIPGTAIKTDIERHALQKWLDCTSTQGEWRWQPLANSSDRRPLVVHKQGPLQARCDRSYYQAQERQARNLKADGWSVRPSLKFRWYPSNQCNSLRPRQLKQDIRLSRRDLCRLLRHKNVLIVGDIAQYAMHDLLLDWTSTKPVTCYGDLYCKEHGICGNELQDSWNGSAIELESGALDDYVYQRLPVQRNTTSFDATRLDMGPSRANSEAIHHRFETGVSPLNTSFSSVFPRSSSHKIAPHGISKASSKPSITHGTILRFRRSDSLWASSSPSHRRFTPVWQHENIGIRDINNYWITDSRKSDLVILSRPPLPFPLTSHRQNAFTMTTEIPAPHLQYLDHVSRNKSCPSAKFFEDGGLAAAADLVDMARRMVLEVWLPEILYSLLSLRSTASPPDQLMVWRGDWRIQVDCASQNYQNKERARKRNSESNSKSHFDWGSWWYSRARGDGPPMHASAPTLLWIMFSELADQLQDQTADRPTAARRNTLDARIGIQDTRTVFHNLQVIFQNQLMRQLAPAFGIPYLGLESLASIWRSGMVGGSSVDSTPAPSVLFSSSQSSIFNSFRPSPNKALPKSTFAAKDCLHYCFPSPGMAIEEGFIGGLLKIFHAGWDSQPERDSWVGDLFVPVRDRYMNRSVA